MIKLVFCLRRLPILTSEQFYDYWLGTHGPLVRSVAADLGMARYTQSHLMTGQGLTADAEARGMEGPPFDGVAELWWNSLDELAAVTRSKAARAAGRLLLEDERRFIDLPRSPLFYAREHVVVGA